MRKMTTRHCTVQNDFVGTKWLSVVIVNILSKLYNLLTKFITPSTTVINDCVMLFFADTPMILE